MLSLPSYRTSIMVGDSAVFNGDVLIGLRSNVIQLQQHGVMGFVGAVAPEK